MRDMNWTLTFVDLTVSKLMYDDVLMMYVLNDPEFLENNIVIDIVKRKVDTSGKCKTLKNSVPCVSLVL